MGEVSEDELYEAFREQAIALEEGGADACIIETMADLDEARCAVQAVKKYKSGNGCQFYLYAK
jgi:5-methyltetrahydrofolate--homocysteine methyltransferase